MTSFANECCCAAVLALYETAPTPTAFASSLKALHAGDSLPELLSICVLYLKKEKELMECAERDTIRQASAFKNAAAIIESMLKF